MEAYLNNYMIRIHTAKSLVSPLDVHIMLVASVSVGTDGSAKTFTITTKITATSVIVAGIEVWSWVHHFMTLLEISIWVVDNIALFV